MRRSVFARLDNLSEGMFIKTLALEMFVFRMEWGEFAAAMSPSIFFAVNSKHSIEHGDELEFSL